MRSNYHVRNSKSGGDCADWLVLFVAIRSRAVERSARKFSKLELKSDWNYIPSFEFLIIFTNQNYRGY